MITSEKSRQLLLMKIENKFHWYINETYKLPGICLTSQQKTLRKLFEVYILITTLPGFNPIFEWCRLNIDKIQIYLDDDKVRIYKIEGQYLEQVEFVDGDLSHLIYKALESQN
ncbi:MAG: hypothetical protein R6U58_11265 [Bacteroidales bacterium]